MRHHRIPLAIAILLVGSILLAACSSEPETPPAPSKNATIKAYLQESKTIPGGQVKYNLTVTNTGDEKDYDVAIEHRIFSTPLGRVIKTEGEIVNLETWVYKDKSLALPSDAPTGNYQLIVSITYGENKTAEASAYFDVAKPIEEVNITKKGATGSGAANTSNPPANLTKPADTSKPNNPINGSASAASAGANTSGAGGANSSTNKTSASTPLTGAASADTSAGASPSSPETPPDVHIDHKDRQFSPQKVTVPIGTTVIWKQVDKSSTQVDGPGFHSGIMGPGKEFKHTFKKPGIFDFYSSFTKASGTITVEDPDHPLEEGRDPTSFRAPLGTETP